MRHILARAEFGEHIQAFIERYHRSLKNIVELVNYFDPWTLERELAHWVEYYNHQRYHESLNNVPPADKYFGRAQEVQTRREEIKQQTLAARRQQHRPVLLAVGPDPIQPGKCLLVFDPKLSHCC